ncbi:MAG: SH3 domain-containing protein [Synergistaceae bacterium]|jgi:hypothetical protein|nr:SH3 domain-containing protein [Synergistaceae bacterium]
MKMNAEKIAVSGVMDDLKHSLNELRELLEEKYITESEYVAARANALWDAGVDIAARARPAERMRRLKARSRRAGAGRDCGRFLIPGFLAAGALACAAFFFWMRSESGLFSPHRRKDLLPKDLFPSTAPLPSALLPPVDPARGASAGESSENSVPSLNIGENIFGVPADGPGEAVSAESGVPGWGVVSARRVRVRAAPDAAADNVLGWARKGDRFAVLGEALDGNRSKWYNIRYEKVGGEGWIKASMMTLEGR